MTLLYHCLGIHAVYAIPSGTLHDEEPLHMLVSGGKVPLDFNSLKDREGLRWTRQFIIEHQALSSGKSSFGGIVSCAI